MYILAIETTGAFASVAVAAAEAEEFRILAEVNGCDRFSHVQKLAPQIQQALEAAGQNEGKDCPLPISDIDLIAVSQGPGSFTGIRIGITTGRALAQVLNKDCTGVPTLDALAMCGPEAFAGAYDENTLFCPILDARRSQVYGGGYFIRGGFPQEEVKAGPYTIDEFLELIAGYEKVCFLGDGIDTCEGAIREKRSGAFDFAPEKARYQKAAAVARLAGRMAEEGRVCQFGQLQPQYMRMAEAERKLKEKQNG